MQTSLKLRLLGKLGREACFSFGTKEGRVTPRIYFEKKMRRISIFGQKSFRLNCVVLLMLLVTCPNCF
jgi:hypothetical protein